MKYFHPPIGKSTFHDLVNRGTIVPLKGIRGYYRLNDSLRRMGLREVKAPPANPHCSVEDFHRLAFNLIDPLIFPAPSCMLDWEPLPQDWSHARFLADLHRENIEQFDCAELKIAYSNGAFDAIHEFYRENS